MLGLHSDQAQWERLLRTLGTVLRKESVMLLAVSL
jgi:hypothetical protein